MSNKIAIFIFLLLVLPTTIFADLIITVEPDNSWGNARTSNIKRLCENVALHFQEQLRDEHKINGKLKIVHHPGHPIAFYKTHTDVGYDYQIGLSASDTFWSQFSVQFGHEFTHVLHNFDDKKWQKKVHWFEEAMAELGSLWVIRQMSETWEDRAPYINWVSYRHSLASYANNLENGAEVQYRGSGKEWLEKWESNMRNQESYNYATLAQLSYKFLPIFEKNPEAWNAVRQMPISEERMEIYMKQWHDKVDYQDKKFVAEIAKEMGISLGASVVASTLNADVNNDGYVDLSDVRIVRSAIRNSVSYNTDINGDGKTDETDVLIVKAKAHAAIVAAAPSLKRRKRITTWGALKRR